MEKKDQALHWSVPRTLPLVWSDKTRLVQILTNLVSNAHKYTPEGGDIYVKVKHMPRPSDAGGVPESVHILVQDNGIGISPEDQQYIFKQFFRSEDAQVRQESGTGLGLNITRKLVEMQGGKMWFESLEGEGTTFHFTFPVADVEG